MLRLIGFLCLLPNIGLCVFVVASTLLIEGGDLWPDPAAQVLASVSALGWWLFDWSPGWSPLTKLGGLVVLGLLAGRLLLAADRLRRALIDAHGYPFVIRFSGTDPATATRGPLIEYDWKLIAAQRAIDAPRQR